MSLFCVVEFKPGEPPKHSDIYGEMNQASKEMARLIDLAKRQGHKVSIHIQESFDFGPWELKRWCGDWTQGRAA